MPKPLIHKMRTRSKKRAKQEREYSKVRKEFLEENPVCQIRGCDGCSTQVHHKKGRIGALLTDKKFFLAVCALCHYWLELHPEWAKEHGYSLSRLAKEEVSELKKV